MKNIYLQIKWAYQRVKYGFDERVNWSFSTYFLAIIPTLKKFCIKELADVKKMELNEIRRDIYLETIRLINNEEKYQDEFNQSKMIVFIAEHLEWYWS